jgi:hypothetical protein
VSQAFSRLLEIHRELDDIFLLHGECLLEGELDLAREVLETYRVLLQVHLQHEESVLFPLYLEVGVAPRFPLVLYSGQHQKLNALLDGIIRRMQGLRGRGPVVRRQILSVFDQETTFKHLVEHHDGAERDGLFARLDVAVTRERAEALLDPLWDEWWNTRAAIATPLTRARSL